MCNGFGGIVTRDGRVLFCEPDNDGNCSHSELLKRVGMEDSKNIHLRHFVRFEFPEWTEESFHWDEDDTLPGWVSPEHEESCKRLLARCDTARAEYEKVCAPAWAEYRKVCDTAWAEYRKVCAPAWAEYQKVCAPAWAEYQKVCDTARAEYQKVCAPAWAEYEKVRDTAWAEFVQLLSTITGYVPAKLCNCI